MHSQHLPLREHGSYVHVHFLRFPFRFVQSVIFGFGSGLGFTLALLIMAGIREELEFADVPETLKGAAITLIIAGLLALAFMGFGGLISA